MSTLYELTGQMKQLAEMPDMDPETLADTLEGLEGEISVKANNIAYVDQQWDNYIESIDEMIGKLQARKKVFQNNRKRLRDYLQFNMLAAGISNITGALISITLAKGRDVVSIDNEADLPDDYLTIKTLISPDKRKILADLKNGINIPGATLIKSEPTLRIKT